MLSLFLHVELGTEISASIGIGSIWCFLPGFLLRLEEMAISVRFSPVVQSGLRRALGSMAATILDDILLALHFA